MLSPRDSLRSLRERTEDWPITPSRCAEAALSSVVARRRRAARADPQWAEIEARREVSGSNTVRFLSTDHNLGFPEYATQNEIAKRLVPDPWWWPAAQRVRHWHFSRVTGASTNAYQRATRGWADTDAYNTGRHLATITAAMLIRLAETAHGWPGECDEFATIEEWEALLRANAATLSDWTTEKGMDELRSRWFAAACAGDPAAKELSAELYEHELALADNARAAMRWVADHLPDLWD